MPLAWDKKTQVAPGTETTIVSYQVGEGRLVKLDGFIAFGTCAAIYRLYADSEVKASYMTSEADRNAYVIFRTEHVTGPKTITVKALHFIPAAPGEGQDFEGTILGG